MSLGQAAEISLVKSDFLARLASNEFEDLTYGPALSDGTHVFARVAGVWRAFLISDMTAPETRRGKVTVAIAAGLLRGTAAVVLSPALRDVIANYVCMATVNDVTQIWSADVDLTSKTALSVAVYRVPNNPGNTGNAATGVTVAGNDLTVIDVTTQNPHGANAGFFPHNHTTTGHPVTDPTHNHGQVIFTGGAQVSANVDWLVWHI